MTWKTLEEAPDVLTAGETAKLLRLGRNAVYDQLRTGAIPSIKLGKRLLVPKAALRRLLEQAENPA